MRIPRIYTGQLLVSGATLELEPGPSHHLSKVLRMRVGAPLILFDGNDQQVAATICEVTKKAVMVVLESVETISVESPLAIHLGIAVSRGERMDWVVQKATELGVAMVTPLISERAEVKLSGERAGKKVQHWQQIAIGACEQSGRNRLPQIADLTPLADWVAAVRAQQKWVLHHRSESRLDAGLSVASAALLIGPEGGLSDAEIHLAETHGFTALTLGPRVLRTETAPVAAISLLQYVWGDLR